MPFMKPRFEMVDGELQQVPVDLDALKDVASAPQEMLRQLQLHDGYYQQFENFKRTSFTPLSYGLNYAYKKLLTFEMYVRKEPSDREGLLLEVLIHFDREVSDSGARLVLLLLPNRDAVLASNPWSPALFRHQRLIQLLEGTDLKVVDARLPLREIGGDVFHADATHFTAEGNRVIADHLAESLLP